jgi:hypothetical protein
VNSVFKIDWNGVGLILENTYSSEISSKNSAGLNDKENLCFAFFNPIITNAIAIRTVKIYAKFRLPDAVYLLQNIQTNPHLKERTQC